MKISKTTFHLLISLLLALSVGKVCAQDTTLSYEEAIKTLKNTVSGDFTELSRCYFSYEKLGQRFIVSDLTSDPENPWKKTSSGIEFKCTNDDLCVTTKKRGNFKAVFIEPKTGKDVVVIDAMSRLIELCNRP